MVYSAISDSVGTIMQFTRYESVTLSHSGVLTAYQTKLTIPFKAGMQATFGDIRFNVWNGTVWEYVPHWLESKTDSDTADVWIKNDYADGDTVVRMYYGNAGLSSESSIADTFIDGSEFDDLTGWTQQSGTWTTSGGKLLSPSSGEGYLRRTTPISESSYIVTTKAMTTNNLRFITLSEANNPMDGTVALAGQVSPATNVFDLRTDWSWSTVSETFNNDTFYITEIDVVSGSNIMRVYDANHNYLGETPTRIDGSGTENYWGFYVNGDDNEYDWVHVRQYTATEPTYTIGTPQHQRRAPQFIN